MSMPVTLYHYAQDQWGVSISLPATFCFSDLDQGLHALNRWHQLFHAFIH